MSDSIHGDKRLTASSVEMIDRLCDRFESAWQQGHRPPIAGCLAEVAEPLRPVLLRELLRLEIDYRKRAGEVSDLAELQAQFPQYREVVEAVLLEGERAVDRRTKRCRRLPGPGTTISEPRRGDGLQDPRVSMSAAPTATTPLNWLSTRRWWTSIVLRVGAISALSTARRPVPRHRLTRVAQFELVERLGMGAFGTVWKARDTTLNRTVAIKIPRQGQLDRDEAERFMREARSVAPLRHPNIVTVHEVGKAGPLLYIVSDFVRGVPLSELLADRRLGRREAVEIARKISEALHHAHENGVIHRDLKPHNIMIDIAGEPHLTDFGLAKRESVEITMTVEGAILGTPAYMSPEQAKGEGHTRLTVEQTFTPWA